MERKQTHGFGSFGKVAISVLEGAVISSFFPEAGEMTIKEIQARVDHSYERVNSALKSLVQNKIVIETQKGKTLIYLLDLQNLYAYVGFDHYVLEREIDFIRKHKILYNAIKEIMDNDTVWMVVLFGSYSKDAETNHSDVDIICISDKKADTKNFVKSLKYKYDVAFAPIVLQLNEFANIRKDDPELWIDLKMYSIVFKGVEWFYDLAYKR